VREEELAGRRLLRRQAGQEQPGSTPRREQRGANVADVVPFKHLPSFQGNNSLYMTYINLVQLINPDKKRHFFHFFVFLNN